MRGKVETFCAMLQVGKVRVRLDARRPGVVLPAQLKADPQLVLEYGRNLPNPIPDLEVDGFGIKATLSFKGKPALTFVTWDAIWALENEGSDGGFWVDSMPDEVEFRRRVPGNAEGGAAN